MDTKNSPSNWVKKLRKYRFMGYFALSQAILMLAFFAFVAVFEKDLPAPRISSSESFNEKARWLHNWGNKKCDVLVIGSSMALNNIDWVSIKPMLKNKSLVNTASWDMTVSKSASMLKYVAPICKPDLIVLVAFFGDFNAKENQPIDWEFFQQYLGTLPTGFAYLKSADFAYYASTFANLKILASKGNSVYESLNFDETGSVILDCDHFQRSRRRWDGYDRYLSLLDKRKVQIELDGLLEIENIAKANRSRLVVIATPLRKTAEEKVANTWATALLGDVAQSVQATGGQFVQAGLLADFPDLDFADFAHLNKCGATKVAELIAPTITNALIPLP
jgi:hypothetical protein